MTNISAQPRARAAAPGLGNADLVDIERGRLVRLAHDRPGGKAGQAPGEDRADDHLRGIGKGRRRPGGIGRGVEHRVARGDHKVGI